MWCNYHTHSDFCDGASSIAGIREAARGCLLQVGISSHAPLPFPRPWSMEAARLDAYIRVVGGCGAEGYPVKLGLEVDFIPGATGPQRFRDKVDYTIGSIHFVDESTDGPWEVDGPFSVFEEGFNRIFRGNAKSLVHRYYELTRLMIRDSPPDVVGHLDKLKIQNRHQPVFDEQEAWYRKEVTDTLKVIRDAGVIVEVNTRGWYQGKTREPYPSWWILACMHDMHIPVTLSSDAHQAKDLANHFPQAAVKLLRMGFKNLTILSEDGWRAVPFDERGIRV